MGFTLVGEKPLARANLAGVYVLEIMSGPLDGTRWPFEREITIGRDESLARACIAFDRYLSRSHAQLEVLDGRLHLRDLTSRNGTTVAGEVVTDEYVEIGQRFTCGRTSLCVRYESAAQKTALLANPALEIITSSADMHARRPVGPIGFVPTMGALHAGHVALIKQAQSECASVIVSIFVNPLQFAAGEDFDRYPRDPERDVQVLTEHGVTQLFAPAVGTFYESDFSTSVDVGLLGEVFEGALRPTHFRGVATVITKLLNVVQPTRIYLGQKDAQQVAVLKRVIADLEIPVELVVVPTAREADGLARSSRNVYLNAGQRRRAPILHAVLQTTADAYRQGATRERALALGHECYLQSEGYDAVHESLQYLEIVHEATFEPLAEEDRNLEHGLVIGSLWLGKVRLLDNVPLRPRAE